MTNSFMKIAEEALQDPAQFWADAAGDIDWITPATTILDDSNPPFYRWFVGGSLNGCYNAIDRHVLAGRGEQAAIIYDSPVTNTKRTKPRNSNRAQPLAHSLFDQLGQPILVEVVE